MYRIIKRLLCSMAFIICLMSSALFGCTRKEIVSLEKEKASVEDQTEELQAAQENKEASKRKQKTVCVYVCGEVNHPGVYELIEGSRVYEVIEKAGGMTENAAFSYLNQAEVLVDGGRVYVPSVQEEAQADGTLQERMDKDGGDLHNGSGVTHGKININKAGKEELMTLTGIGESKAEDIITYRKENGLFQTIEDIKQIRGIKDGVFNKIKEDITV